MPGVIETSSVSPSLFRQVMVVCSCVVAFAVATLAASADQGLTTAKVLAIKEHPHGRLVRWEGRSPVFDGYPVYDITLDWKGKKYVVRYESYSGYYPGSWATGKEIQVKRERGRFILFSGEERVPAREVNPNDCIDVSFPGAGSASSQVPCD